MPYSLRYSCLTISSRHVLVKLDRPISRGVIDPRQNKKIWVNFFLIFFHYAKFERNRRGWGQILSRIVLIWHGITRMFIQLFYYYCDGVEQQHSVNNWGLVLVNCIFFPWAINDIRRKMKLCIIAGVSLCVIDGLVRWRGCKRSLSCWVVKARTFELICIIYVDRFQQYRGSL